jgi:hypothetical protein
LIVKFELLEDISTDRLSIYSVKLGNNFLNENEYDKFLDKREEFLSTEHIAKEYQILIETLFQIGRRGALRHYFKDEKSANYLPKVNEKVKELNIQDYGLRLYCIRLRDDLLILLNGAVKTKQNPMDCPNVYEHFKNAINIADALDKALENDFVTYKNGLIEFENDFELNI